MEPMTIAWIIAVVAGSTAAKLAAIFVKNENLGQTAVALIGIFGAIANWQPAILIGIIDPLNYVHTGLISLWGGLTTYISLAIAHKKWKAKKSA